MHVADAFFFSIYPEGRMSHDDDEHPRKRKDSLSEEEREKYIKVGVDIGAGTEVNTKISQREDGDFWASVEIAQNLNKLIDNLLGGNDQ